MSFSSHDQPAGSSKTIFPKVLSVSRATDIPAFHAQWFMERLREGFCEWQNPFNANQRQIVSFAETEAIVFWSKNPARLMPYLPEIADKGKKFYFQFTLNDYADEQLEQGLLPSLEERVQIFTDLSKQHKVIWRYDPVIMGDRLTIKGHMRKLKFLVNAIGHCTDKLVFSFVDLYGRVAQNIKKHHPDLRAPSQDEMRQFAIELLELRDKYAPALKLATCAEGEVDFQSLGIEKNSCIDAALINQLCGKDIFKKMTRAKKPAQPSLFTDNANALSAQPLYEKDKGQRKECQCAPSKDIGSYRAHACGHHCVYCYAGHAQK